MVGNAIQFEKVRAWVFDAALPLWAERGVDRDHGGFLEELAPDGSPTGCEYKRVRTMCRQIYVFSHAALLGWSAGEELSRMGVEYLSAHARLENGGWARRLSSTGAIVDDACDLYDLAFVIFAMAWRYRASGDPNASRLALETISFVREHMRGPGGAFLSALPASGPRLQNPHMHLTEACLAAFESTQDQVYLDTADELVALFGKTLFDGRFLRERFSENWTPLPSPLEPGHHFEWVWILGEHRRLKGAPVERYAPRMQSLALTAESLGTDTVSKAVLDAVDEKGAPVRASSRIWPNTERIKAYAALYDHLGRDPSSEIASSLTLIFDRYFADARAGLWIDHFDLEGRPLSNAVPASCVYHLLLAFSEVLRLQGRLVAARP